MIIFNKDTERNNKKDRAQDVRIDSLQTAVDELNADIAEIEITVENLSQSIDDKYAAQTQTLMSELNSRIQGLISNLENFVNTAQVNADVGNFKNLYATVLSNLKNLTVDYATVTQSATVASATITTETVTSSQIQSLQVATAVISELTATLLHITNLAVTELTAEAVSSDSVVSRYGQFSDITVQGIADINLVTGSTPHSPIGVPDNTELLKITVPHYKGTVHIIDYDNSFNVTIYDGAFISWGQTTMNLYRVQKGFNTTDLYFKDTDLNMSYKVLLVGSHYPVTVTSEIVDRTGIRQNVSTRNGVYGVAEGGGASIIFVDDFPEEGEEGVIYISRTEGAKAWDDERNAFIPFVGSNLPNAVSDNTEHIGTLSNLTTTEKTNLVGAVNEVDSHADTITANIGSLSSLATTEKTTIVAAINEVDSNTDTNTSAIATINGNDTGLSMREVAQNVTSNLYIPCGSVAFADLPALSGLRVGSVYDVTDSFTTTSDFIEGAGHVIPAGSNVAVVDYNGVKKWDVLGSMVDLSTYYTKAQTDNLLAAKTDLSVIAPEFSVSTSYAVGDYVTYDGKLYGCTTAHPAGAWVSSDFTEKTVSGITSGSDEYMAKVNPTGTGSFSLNRKANTTIGDYSHAEGYETTASKTCAHAEGSLTTASGLYSHAEGSHTTANGLYSHAEGSLTTASGIYSHAEGLGTITEVPAQHVQGTYNVRDTNGIYADIIGNGVSESERKNIEATTRTGDKRLKGTVYINCNDDSTGGTDLGTTANQALLLAQSFSHNIPRYVNGVLGKDITAYYNDGTLWKRLNGTDGFMLFEDIYVGDYFKMSRAISAYERTGQYKTTGSQYVTIAGLDTMMNNGDQGSGVNYHHAVMVAGQGFGGTQHFGRSRMNATNTTEGGYKASEMNTLVLGDVVSAGSTAADATINQQLYAEFGSHLKTTRELVSNAINATGYNRFGSATGCASNWEWISAQAILMSEVEAYGSIAWSSSGYDTGNANRQLPLFAFSKQAQNNRSAYWWLKDIASAANFCRATDRGHASYTDASDAGTCVRPRFIIA